MFRSKFGSKPRVYLASPLFNEIERSFNLEIADKLAGFADVFVPQRDGKLLKEMVDAGYQLAAAREIVYRGDITAITDCDILVAILDGRTIDEGVAFELGYARALGKFCLGLKTDDRSLLPTGDNPMIVVGCHHICSTLADLIRKLAALESLSMTLSF